MSSLVIEPLDPHCPGYTGAEDPQSHYAPWAAHTSIPPVFEAYCVNCRRRHPYGIRQAQATKRRTLKLRHLLGAFVIGQAFNIGFVLYAAHAFASK